MYKTSSVFENVFSQSILGFWIGWHRAKYSTTAVRIIFKQFIRCHCVILLIACSFVIICSRSFDGPLRVSED